MKSHRAFTIVEILIIISVITILAGIASLGYSGMQRDARNKERESDIAIIQTALEQFYEKNGYYPPMDKMTGESEATMTFLTRDLNIPDTALVAPNSPQGTKNSLVPFPPDFSQETFRKSYIYVPAHETAGGGIVGDQCTEATAQCVAYGMGYIPEDSDSVKEIKSKYGW